MLRMMLLPDKERFLDIVDHSRGDVLLCLPDHTDCDLKTDPAARELLRLLGPGEEGVDLRLTDPGDLPAYLRYMMEAVLAEKNAQSH